MVPVRPWSSAIVALSLACAALPACPAAADELVIATGAGEPWTAKDGTGFCESVVVEAFERLGLEARVMIVPPARALINANAGTEDGDLMRIAGVDKAYPNLVPVPEPLVAVSFVAIALADTPAFVSDGWESLEPYDIGLITGVKIFENNARWSRSVTTAKSRDQLFELLRKRRVEVVLLERWHGLWWARQHGLAVRIMQPPLATKEFFLYLNKKHAELVPRLAEALRAIKADGTWRRHYERVLAPLERMPDS